MSFAEDNIPIVFDKILEMIDENGGQITTDEFKKKIRNFRFTNDDAQYVKKWLNLNGYVILNHNKIIIKK